MYVCFSQSGCLLYRNHKSLGSIAECINAYRATTYGSLMSVDLKYSVVIEQIPRAVELDDSRMYGETVFSPSGQLALRSPGAIH